MPTFTVTALEHVTPLVPHGTELGNELIIRLLSLLSFSLLLENMTARWRAGQEIAQNDHLSPDDHGKGVCPAHLSTGKHVFTVAMEVEHFLIEGPAGVK